jgi:hypothetical protein
MPASLTLDGTERAAVERHVCELGAFLDVRQTIVLRDKTLSNDQAHGVMIAGLLLKGGRKLDQAASDALTEDYLDAIEDLPAWCVREAIRKWNRGESAQLDKKPHDFTWRPEAPTLARLARLEKWAVEGRIKVLERLLSAEPLPEYGDAHKVDMRQRLAAVMPWAAQELLTGQPQREAAE